MQHSIFHGSSQRSPYQLDIATGIEQITNNLFPRQASTRYVSMISTKK